MNLKPGHFTLKTAEDLFRKLERDFELIRARPLDSDVCFNFFVTAEHLPEWHFKGDSKKAAAHRKSKALLRVCSHLANLAASVHTDPKMLEVPGAMDVVSTFAALPADRAHGARRTHRRQFHRSVPELGARHGAAVPQMSRTRP